MNTHFWKYWACNGKFKPQHIYVLAIISSSFITLHDEIANSQCRVHNKCTDGSFCFIRNGKSTPILFNLLASTFRWKNFSFFNYSFLFITKQNRKIFRRQCIEAKMNLFFNDCNKILRLQSMQNDFKYMIMRHYI